MHFIFKLRLMFDKTTTPIFDHKNQNMEYTNIDLMHHGLCLWWCLSVVLGHNLFKSS
jgi:hypothetical protein